MCQNMKSSKSLNSASDKLVGFAAKGRGGPLLRHIFVAAAFAGRPAWISGRRCRRPRPGGKSRRWSPGNRRASRSSSPAARQRHRGCRLALSKSAGVRAADQHRDIQHRHRKFVSPRKLQPIPIRIDEHQLDIGPPRDHVHQPAVVLVIGKDLVVQLAHLLVRDRVEVDAIQVAKPWQQVAVKAGRAGVVKIVLRDASTTRRMICPPARSTAD